MLKGEIKPLPNFDYFVPSSLDEALRLLERYGNRAKLLAGGTDLLLKLKNHSETADVILDLNKISELSCIEMIENNLRIGSLTRLARIEKTGLVKDLAQALVDAVGTMACPSIRNRATLGGNLCTASSSADTAPPLLALNASVSLISTKGQRIIPLHQFFVGPGENVMKTGEVLTAVYIPVQDGSSAFIKLGRRKAMTLSVVSVAVFVKVYNGRFEQVRIALGAVSSTPMRGRKVEKALIGEKVNEQTIRRAAELVKDEINPNPMSLRASPEYRREMASTLVNRILKRIAMGGLC